MEAHPWANAARPAPPLLRRGLRDPALHEHGHHVSVIKPIFWYLMFDGDGAEGPEGMTSCFSGVTEILEEIGKILRISRRDGRERGVGGAGAGVVAKYEWFQNKMNAK